MASEFMLFTPVNDGVGASLSCSGSTSRVELPYPDEGSVWAVNNTGLDYVFLAFGLSPSLEATTACMAFAPGLTYLGIPNAGSTSAPRWMAGITAGTVSLVQITAGVTETS